jgi:hypothetical protein
MKMLRLGKTEYYSIDGKIIEDPNQRQTFWSFVEVPEKRLPAEIPDGYCLTAVNTYEISRDTGYMAQNDGINFFLLPEKFFASFQIQDDSQGIFRHHIVSPGRSSVLDGMDDSFAAGIILHYIYSSSNMNYMEQHKNNIVTNALRVKLGVPYWLGGEIHLDHAVNIIGEGHVDLNDEKIQEQILGPRLLPLVKSGKVKFHCLDICMKWEE